MIRIRLNKKKIKRIARTIELFFMLSPFIILFVFLISVQISQAISFSNSTYDNDAMQLEIRARAIERYGEYQD